MVVRVAGQPRAAVLMASRCSQVASATAVESLPPETPIATGASAARRVSISGVVATGGCARDEPSSMGSEIMGNHPYQHDVVLGFAPDLSRTAAQEHVEALAGRDVILVLEPRAGGPASLFNGVQVAEGELRLLRGSGHYFTISERRIRA